jgi:hypothetical protein
VPGRQSCRTGLWHDWIGGPKAFQSCQYPIRRVQGFTGPGRARVTNLAADSNKD